MIALATVLFGALHLHAAYSSSVIYASYRKDFFYPYDEYPEADLPDPVDGGRFHLVSVSETNGSAAQVTLNGKPVTFESGQDPDTWFVDWMHIYPATLTQGQPVWISFHTRNKDFDKKSSGSIDLTSSTGMAVSGTFPIQLNPCNITYVITTANYSTLLVHIHNGFPSSARTIKTVLVNNTDMTAKVSNRASLSVAPLSSTLLSIPLSARQFPGNLVTVVLLYSESGAMHSAAGVRLAKTHFPIESWPKSKECPFPKVNDANYKFHRDHGIDTLYFGNGAAVPCGSSVLGTTIAGTLAPHYGFYCLISTDIQYGSMENTSNVLARLLGDESDVKLDDGLRDKMTATDKYWKEESSILTYLGGSRSRRNGIFAGVTDIQGMDMYVAACAPHIQLYLHPPPLRGSYDYMRLVRYNHMPLTQWTYSQLLDDGWDAKVGSTVITHRQPNPDEARIQAMSVVAAGSKGIMYFQSEIAEKEYYPDTWKEIANFNKDIGAVREYLREGDCTDMITTSDGTGFDAKSAAQAIRSQEAVLVAVINLKNDGGISDPACSVGVNEHWDILEHTVSSISVVIPTDFGSVIDSFEVLNGKILNITTSTERVELGVDYHGNAMVTQSVMLSNVALSSSISTRLFVFANSNSVRETVKRNLQ